MTNKTQNCDSETVSLVEPNFNFTANTGRGQTYSRGTIIFQFHCRIACVDDSAYSLGDGEAAMYEEANNLPVGLSFH